MRSGQTSAVDGASWYVCVSHGRLGSRLSSRGALMVEKLVLALVGLYDTVVCHAGGVVVVSGTFGIGHALFVGQCEFLSCSYVALLDVFERRLAVRTNWHSW